MKKFYTIVLIIFIFNICNIPDNKAEQLTSSPIWLKNESAFTQLDQNEQFYFVKRYEDRQNNMFVIGFAVYSFSPAENTVKVWAYDQKRRDFVNIKTMYYAPDRLEEIYAAVLSKQKSLPVSLSNTQLFYLYVWSSSSSSYSNSYGNMFILPKNVFLHRENRLYFYKHELDTMRLSIIHKKTNQFHYCPYLCRAVFFDQQGYGFIQSYEQTGECEKNPLKPIDLTKQRMVTDIKAHLFTNERKEVKFNSTWKINKDFLNKLNDDEKLYFVKCSQVCNDSSFILGFVIYSYSSISKQWRIWQYNNNSQQFEIYKILNKPYWVNKCHREINEVVLMKNFSIKRVSKLIPDEKLFKIKIWSSSKKLNCGVFSDTFVIPLPENIITKDSGVVSRLYFNKNELNSMQLVNVQQQKYYLRMNNLCHNIFSDEHGYACFQYKDYNEKCVAIQKKSNATYQSRSQVKKQRVRWYQTKPNIDTFDNKEYHLFDNYGYVHLNAYFYKNNNYIEPHHNYFITNISNKDIVYSPISCNEQFCSFYKRNDKGYFSCLWIVNNTRIYPVGILNEDWYSKTLFLDINLLKRSVDNDLLSTFHSLSDFFKKYHLLSLQQRAIFRKLACEKSSSCLSDFQVFDKKQYADMTDKLNNIQLKIKPEIIQLDNGWQLEKKNDRIWIAQKKNTAFLHQIKPPLKKAYNRVRLEKDGKGKIVDYYIIDVHDEFVHHNYDQIAYQATKKVQIKPDNIQIQSDSRKTTPSKIKPSQTKTPQVTQIKKPVDKIWIIFDDYVDNSGYLARRFKQFKQSYYVKKLFNSCEVSRFDLIQGVTIKRRPSHFKIWNNSQFFKVAEIQSLLDLAPHSFEEKNTKWELHLFLARNTRGIGYEGIEEKLYRKLKNLNVKTIIVWEFCDYKPAEITMYKKLFSDVSSQNRFNYQHFLVTDDYSIISIPFYK